MRPMSICMCLFSPRICVYMSRIYVVNNIKRWSNFVLHLVPTRPMSILMNLSYPSIYVATCPEFMCSTILKGDQFVLQFCPMRPMSILMSLSVQAYVSTCPEFMCSTMFWQQMRIILCAEKVFSYRVIDSKPLPTYQFEWKIRQITHLKWCHMYVTIISRDSSGYHAWRKWSTDVNLSGIIFSY